MTLPPAVKDDNNKKNKSRSNSCRCQRKEEGAGNVKLQRYIDTKCDGNVPVEDNDDWFIFHHSYSLCSYPNVQFGTKVPFVSCRYYKSHVEL